MLKNIYCLQKVLCIVRESNPGRPRGRRAFYHWTNDALLLWFVSIKYRFNFFSMYQHFFLKKLSEAVLNGLGRKRGKAKSLNWMTLSTVASEVISKTENKFRRHTVGDWAKCIATEKVFRKNISTFFSLYFMIIMTRELNFMLFITLLTAYSFEL